MINLCSHYHIPSMQCQKMLILGASEELVCNRNGHCNYPFNMIPKEYTCKHFKEDPDKEKKNITLNNYSDNPEKCIPK
jgi:hypothetical protein